MDIDLYLNKSGFTARKWVDAINSHVPKGSVLNFVWSRPLSIPDFAYVLLTEFADYKWRLRSYLSHWENFNTLRVNKPPENCLQVRVRYNPSEGVAAPVHFASRVRDLYRAGYPVTVESPVELPHTFYSRLRMWDVPLEVETRVCPVEWSWSNEEKGVDRRWRDKVCPGDYQVVGPSGELYPCAKACLWQEHRYGSLEEGFRRQRDEGCKMILCPYC